MLIGTVVEGTTVNATNDFTEQCGGASVQDSPGVWYTFVGDGRTVKASTCHGDPDIGDTCSIHQIKVYAGNCSALECIDGNDDDY